MRVKKKIINQDKLNDFGKRLYDLIIEAGFKTQKDFAEALGIPDTKVSKWVTGIQYPPHESLSDAAKVLRISLDELITGTPSEPQPHHIELTRHTEAFDWSSIYDMTKKRDILSCLAEFDEKPAVAPYLLEALINESPSLQRNQIRDLNSAVWLALRAGSISIDKVNRKTDYEETLKKSLTSIALQNIIVTDVPKTLAGKYNNSAILRGWLVTKALKDFYNAQNSFKNTYISVGGGTTITMLVQHLGYSQSRFSNITWLPLEETGNTPFTANFNCNLLSANHIGTKCDSPNQQRDAMLSWSSVVWMTVVGVNREAPNNKRPNILIDPHTPSPHGEISQEDMEAIEQNEDAVGWVMGFLVNKDCQPINLTPKAQKMFKALRKVASQNGVCVIASSPDKAPVIAAMLRANLINTLAIDAILYEEILVELAKSK